MSYDAIGPFSFVFDKIDTESCFILTKMSQCCLFLSNREKIGYYDSVNIIKPVDAATLFRAEGYYPKRLRVEAWTSYRDYRNRKYGVLLKYLF